MASLSLSVLSTTRMMNCRAGGEKTLNDLFSKDIYSTDMQHNGWALPGRELSQWAAVTAELMGPLNKKERNVLSNVPLVFCHSGMDIETRSTTQEEERVTTLLNMVVTQIMSRVWCDNLTLEEKDEHNHSRDCTAPPSLLKPAWICVCEIFSFFTNSHLTTSNPARVRLGSRRPAAQRVLLSYFVGLLTAVKCGCWHYEQLSLRTTRFPVVSSKKATNTKPVSARLSSKFLCYH